MLLASWCLKCPSTTTESGPVDICYYHVRDPGEDDETWWKLTYSSNTRWLLHHIAACLVCLVIPSSRIGELVGRWRFAWTYSKTMQNERSSQHPHHGKALQRPLEGLHLPRQFEDPFHQMDGTQERCNEASDCPKEPCPGHFGKVPGPRQILSPQKNGFWPVSRGPKFQTLHTWYIHIYIYTCTTHIYIYTHVISIYIPTMEFHGPAPKTAEAAAKTPRHARAAAEAWWQMVTAAHRSAEAQRNHSPETRSGEAPCFAKGKIYRKPWFRMV